tara:strand:+ start:1035 stop:1733 length:699 start_codon:yes stop_codon:yes gene_type:complete
MAQNIDVLIMCGGKCGSSTLLKTLENNGYKCIKVHSIEDYNNQFQSNKLFDTINISCKKKKFYIIDSYRTPIERKISSFFENIDVHVPRWRYLSIINLIMIFNKNFLYPLEEYHSIDEVLNHYKLPIFKTFNFDKKYNIIHKNNKFFIKILHKDIDNWSLILSKIFKKNINISNENLSKNKNYKHLYEKFKFFYRVPRHYLDYMINYDIEFKIYNSSKEQEDYINYWRNKSY